MYQKLFQISIVLFLLVVSIAVLGVAISVLMSMLSPHLMAETSGDQRHHSHLGWSHE
jgi:hypothetical protein